ncbi:hypothetical protein Tco_0045655 [Tanacetum coccineum]
MAISVISVSLDSSEESVGTSAGRVILFGTIPTTISNTTHTITLPSTHVDTTLTPTKIPAVSPIVSPSPDYTPASPNYSLASDIESDPYEDPSSDLIPPLPATSPFLLSIDDSSNSDTPDTPPSPTYGISDFHSHVTSSADILPPPKRIRSSDSVMDLEVSLDKSSESSVPRETGLRVDIDMLLELGVDVRVVVKTVAREEVETSTRGTVEVREDRVTHPMVSDDIPKLARGEEAIEVTYETLGSLVQRFHDHTMEIPVHRVQVIEGIQRDQGHRIVATSQQGVVISKRISGWSGIIRDLRHLVLLFKELALTSSTMHNTRSRAIMTREAVDNLIASAPKNIKYRSVGSSRRCQKSLNTAGALVRPNGITVNSKC